MSLNENSVPHAISIIMVLYLQKTKQLSTYILFWEMKLQYSTTYSSCIPLFFVGVMQLCLKPMILQNEYGNFWHWDVVETSSFQTDIYERLTDIRPDERASSIRDPA